MEYKFGRYVATFILVSICLFSCKQLPENVLSEAKMQKVLEDMIIAESLAGTKYQVFKDDSTKLALYYSVFRKHNITQPQYDSSLVWYGKDLEAYMRMHERILLNLDKRITDLGDVQASASTSSKLDSVNIWPRRNSLILQPKALFNGLTFDVKPEQSYSSGSSFVLGLRVWGLKDNLKFKPEISLSVVHRDTIITVCDTISKDGYYETVLRSMPTRQVRRVYGHIRMDNGDQDYFKVYIDNLNLIRYNYGTAIPEKTE